jgi:hypothetical protein
VTDHASAVLLLVTLLTLAACAPAASPGPVPAAAECVVVDDSARSRITIGVAAPDGLPDGSAYSAVRLAGAQLHETLVRVDCTGAVIADLADEWSTVDGHTWQFRITRGATFADGSPVDASAIVSAWSAVRTPSLAAVMSAGEHELRVTLHAPAAARAFAEPGLAVVRTAADTWPAGTGPYIPDAAMQDPVLRLIARGLAAGVRIAPVAIVHAPDTIDVRTFGRDLRTAIDAGVDALITNDAAAVAYARARSDYRIALLPWSRTYVLATSPPTDVGAAVPDPGDAFPAEVVGVAARPAAPPFWWQDCVTATVPTPRAVTDGRVLYPRDDPAARAIAERITALARDRAPSWLGGLFGPDGVAPTAAGVSRAELLAALRARAALAVVTSLPRVEYAGCAALTSGPHRLLLTGWHVTALIETRDHLIYRPGIGRVVVDADGTVRFGAQ